MRESERGTLGGWHGMLATGEGFQDGLIRKDAMTMGDLCVDGPNSPPVKSAAEMVGRFQAELISALPGWQARLTAHPEQLEELERDVQAVFDRGAGLLVAGLLAVVMKQPSFDTVCEQTRQGFAYPLAKGRKRQVRLRLLGGLII